MSGAREVDAPSGAAPGPGHGEDDSTLGGYISVHSRPPAFEACDEQPYTVSIETERSGDLKAPVAGYLVFPRWAGTGLGIVGHVESPLLWRGPSREAVVAQAGALALHEVQRLLDEAVLARADEGAEDEGAEDGRGEGGEGEGEGRGGGGGGGTGA